MDFTTEEMEAWIAQTADLNMCLDNGKTMLLYVVANSSNLDALRLLMEYGADVQTRCLSPPSTTRPPKLSKCSSITVPILSKKIMKATRR